MTLITKAYLFSKGKRILKDRYHSLRNNKALDKVTFGMPKNYKLRRANGLSINSSKNLSQNIVSFFLNINHL